MEHMQMNQQSFASFIGIGPASLSSILQERTRPTLNTVEAICSKMPDVNITWLINGTGEMFLSSNQAAGGSNSTGAVDPLTAGATHPMQGNLFGDSIGAVSPNVSNTEPVIRQSPSRPEKIVMSEKNIDTPKRHITEIRVFYDDQTWESFVPKK